MERLSLETQTLYAELIERLTALEAHRTIAHLRGSFALKEVKGKAYYYFKHSEPGDVVREIYVGRKTPELDRVVERFHQEHGVFNLDNEGIERICSMLRAGGIQIIDTASARVLRAFEESGVFYLDGVLVGTHAFIAMGNMLGVKWERSTARTHDIDIAGLPSMGIALPYLEADIPKALKSLEMGFFPVPPFDNKNPSVSFSVRGHSLRVDMLTPQRKPEDTAPVVIPRFKTAAQPLMFLDYLIEKPVRVAAINGGAVLVNIPQPARFAFHKLIVYGARDAAMHVKAGKDLQQAGMLFSFLAGERSGDLIIAWEEIKRRGKYWIKRVQAGLLALKKKYPDQYMSIREMSFAEGTLKVLGLF